MVTMATTVGRGEEVKQPTSPPHHGSTQIIQGYVGRANQSKKSDEIKYLSYYAVSAYFKRVPLLLVHLEKKIGPL